MPTRPPTVRARLRGAAVACVLAVGVGASLATTPPREKCPDPPAEGVISEFYGPQERVGGDTQRVSPAEFASGGFRAVRVYATTPSCLDAGDSAADVTIHFELPDGQPGPIPEETLRSLTVQDGQGRAWSPREVYTREWLPPSSEGGDPYPSFANAVFSLPVQLDPPVTVQLGDLGDATLGELTLWDPNTSRTPGAS